MPSEPVGRLAAHRVGDAGAHVAALGDVARVAEAAHQLGPRPRGAAGAPAELRRLAGEAVAGHGRQDQVERVLGVAAVRVGSVSGPTVSSSSTTEPGQPWVMISGSAFSCCDLHVDEVDARRRRSRS